MSAASASSLDRDIRHAALVAHWHTWASADSSSSENRQTALVRLAAWLAHNDPSTPLDLSGLNLSTLPGIFPDTVQHLDVSDNRLTTLSAQFPGSLQHIDASNNLLSQLSPMPHGLRRLILSNNRLRGLPSHIGALSSSCSINLEHNPVPERIRQGLQGLNQDPRHNGPRFYFTLLEWAVQASPHQFDEALERVYPVWFGGAAHAQTQAPAAEAAQPAREKTREEYFAEWEAWAQEPCGRDEFRGDAIDKMMEWYDANDPARMLDLAELGLRSLPPSWPPGVTRLDIARNNLTQISVTFPDGLWELDISDNPFEAFPEVPEGLEKLVASNCDFTEINRVPSGLEHLDVCGNHLYALPPLPRTLNTLLARSNRLTLTGMPPLPDQLEDLDLASNEFDRMPEPLPAGLEVFDISENQLTFISENLPTQRLEHLDVSGNHLTSLPEWITTRLGSNCTVDIGNNPLPESVRNNLHEAIRAEGYNGPQFFFAESTGNENNALRPLADAVADWLEDEDAAAVWGEFQQEPDADAFSQFLDRLRRTVNYSVPQFRERVVEWLSDLSTRPALRQHSFMIGRHATERCEDRVSLTFNDMKKARLNADVEDRKYDHRLGDLVNLARGMFRLDQLERLAREKVRSLRYVDEIEVYLAYQVKLRERLDLPIDTTEMRFFAVSDVTEDDLNAAERLVKEKENNEFTHYLSTEWQPWQSVLKRMAEAQYKAAEERLIEAMDEPFQTRLDARLQAMGLGGDADAERTLGAQVRDELAHEIKDQLTADFLRAQGLGAALERRWSES